MAEGEITNGPYSYDELKPCPFCGPGRSTVQLYLTDYGRWTVGCGACGSHSGTHKIREAVINNWNRRLERSIYHCEERVNALYRNHTTAQWAKCRLHTLSECSFVSGYLKQELTRIADGLCTDLPEVKWPSA